MHAGYFYAARDREGSQALPAVAPLRRKPRGALLHDLPHPVHRFHVVLERRVAEQTHLRDIGRAQARHAALAFDRLDHRRLFTADVSARAAAKMNRRQRTGWICLQFLNFIFENFPASGILIAQIDIDLSHPGTPRRDQHSLKKTMRVALEIPAVLERARLALVDVHRHHARRRLGSDKLPLAAVRKSGAAQATQRRILHDLGDFLARALAGKTSGDQLVAAILAVGSEVDVFRLGAFELLSVHCVLDRRKRCIRHRILAHHRAGRDLAAPDAGRMQHANVVAEDAGQFLQQVCRSRKRARKGIADPHRQRGGRPFAFLEDIEVVVESRDLVDFGLRKTHFARERGEVPRRQPAVAVLDAMQVFDQQVAAARLRAMGVMNFLQQRLDLLERVRLYAAALQPEFSLAAFFHPAIIRERRREES